MDSGAGRYRANQFALFATRFLPVQVQHRQRQVTLLYDDDCRGAENPATLQGRITFRFK